MDGPAQNAGHEQERAGDVEQGGKKGGAMECAPTKEKLIPDAAQQPEPEAQKEPCCSHPATWTASAWVRLSLLLLLIAFILFVIIDAATTGNVGNVFAAFLEWMRDMPAAGTFAFIGLYILATVAFIPGSILTLGAGFVFSQAFGQGVGIAVGTAVVFAGASIGATLAFLLGKYVFREWVERRIQSYRIMKAVDAAIAQRGALLVVLLRLSPVVPFNAFNYIMSATSCPLLAYLLGHVGMIPGTAAYVYFGSLLSSVKETAEGTGNAEQQDPVLRWTLLSIGLVATLVALVAISFYARRALTEALAAEEEGGEKGGGDTGEKEGGDTGEGLARVDRVSHLSMGSASE